jgi:hypothetical protein
LLSHLGVRHGKRAQAEAVPIGTGGSTCLWAGAEIETWACRRGTRDGGQRRRHPDRELAFGRPGASHALRKNNRSAMFPRLQ